MINYIVVSTFLIVFLLANYYFFYNLNFKKYFLKKKLIQRWSNDDCYLVGGTIFFLAIIFLQLCVSYFIKLNFFTFFEFFFMVLFYLIGLYDDKFNLTGKFKLLIYFLIISFFIFINFYENISYNFLYVSILSIILFIIFVSIGIIDNIDGLLTSNFIIIILFYSVLLFSFEIYNHLFFLINLIFISIFFLFINLNKSNNYLGDSGSNLLAFVLIIIFLKLNKLDILSNTFNINNIILLLGIFSYPLFDIIYVFSIRIFNGISPLQGGTDHSSHRITIIFNSKYKMLFLISIINSIILINSYFLFINLLNIFYYFLTLLILYSIFFLFILKNK